MKKLLTLLLLFICIESIAQSQKETEYMQKEAKRRQEDFYNKPGNFRPNTEFEINKRNYSQDKRYCFVFQKDGNLVIYKMYSETNYEAIWQTRTNGKAIKKCVFQSDGNLVLYDYKNKAVWAAFTQQCAGYDQLNYYWSNSKMILTMQSDGNLVIYGACIGPKESSAASWASGSYEKH